MTGPPTAPAAALCLAGSGRRLLMQGHASSDHTTLLLNCYSKLKDIDKLDAFLKRSAGDAAALHFDTEVAVKVGLREGTGHAGRMRSASVPALDGGRDTMLACQAMGVWHGLGQRQHAWQAA